MHIDGKIICYIPLCLLTIRNVLIFCFYLKSVKQLIVYDSLYTISNDETLTNTKNTLEICTYVVIY